MKKSALVILILALIALVNAAYLSSRAYTLLHNPTAATASGCDMSASLSCSSVIIHPDTMIFGMPFPYLALIVYPLLAILALIVIRNQSAFSLKAIRWISAGGIVFNSYIISREYILDIYCPLCLICTAIIVTIAIISWSTKISKR